MDSHIKKAIEYLEPKARYADVRSTRIKTVDFDCEDGRIEPTYIYDGEGLGIRVLYERGWGFSAGSKETPLLVAKEALRLAKRSNRFNQKYGQEVPFQSRKRTNKTRTYKAEARKDPFEMRRQIREYILATDALLQERTTDHRTIKVEHLLLTKELATTTGAHIMQTLPFIGGSISAALNHKGQWFERSYEGFMLYAQGGFERIEEWDYLTHARRIVNELEILKHAKQCEDKPQDIIISPSLLALQTHETIHGFELDRILGYEGSFAGHSFLSPEDIGTYQLGSEHITIHADPTIPHLAGTFAYDDEATKAQPTILVDKGIVTETLNSRETIAHSGKQFPKLNGTMRAEDDSFEPLIRMSNCFVEPGQFTLQELIADIEDGLLIETAKGFSIDTFRNDFFFSGELGRKIRNGELCEYVQAPSYRGKSRDFWQSCDGVSNKSMILGVSNCGKGQPGQSMFCGHPSPYARFREVQTGGIPIQMKRCKDGCSQHS
jgi:TldD protein